MRTFTTTALLCISASLYAQTSETRSVAVEALNLAVSMTTQEMSACAKAHPQHAERFSASAKEARPKLEAALEKVRAQRAQDLDLKLPEVLAVGREMTAAFISTDPSRQTFEVCMRTADEIRRVTEREAHELMNELVTTLVTGVSAHQQGMNRALR